MSLTMRPPKTKRQAILKNNMRRTLSAVVAVAALCVSLLTGCSTVPAAESVSVTPAQTRADDDFLVGVILYGDKDDESGWTYEHLQGLTQAMEDLGLSPDTDLKIRDGIIDADMALRANVEDLVVMGCDIIFGVSYEYADTFCELAEQYPDVVFCDAYGVLSNDTNYNNYSARNYQAFYLAGIAAGYKSAETGNNSLGFVTSWGIKHCETCSDVNAFLLGARSVNPDAVVYVYPVDSWGDPDAEHRAAQTLVSRYHCGLIAQDCDSNEPQLLAEEEDLFSCGYLTDMTEDAPEAHLTAPVINWNVYYQLALSTAMNESSAQEFVSNISGNYFGTFEDDFLGLSPLTDNNEPEAQEAIDLAMELMLSGQWDVFSGTALVFEGEAGSVTVTMVPCELEDEEGEVVAEAGAPSLSYADLRGYMNSWLDGVIEVP